MTPRETTTKTETTNRDGRAPGAGWGNPQGAMFQMWGQQIEHVDSMYEELGRRQALAVEQVNHAMAELTKMAQDSLAFSTQLGQEWIKAARGTTRWAGELIGAWTR